MGVVAAITTAAVAAAGTGYQIKSSMDARSDAQAQAKKQQDQQNALIKQQQDQANTETANQSRDQALARQKQVQSGALGRSGTLLTGPLGVQQSAPLAGGGKTLLGT